MKKVLFILFLAFLAAVAGEFLSVGEQQILNFGEDIEEANLPQKLEPSDSRSLIFHLPPTGFLEQYRIRIELDKSAQLILPGKTIILGPSAEYCAQRSSGAVSCAIPWKRSDQKKARLVLSAADEPVTVAVFAIDILTKKRISRLGMLDIKIVGLLLFGAIPIVWLLHRHYRASQWFIIGVAVVLLVLVQPVFTAILFAFLTAMHRSGIAMSKRKTRSRGLLLSLILCSLAFVALFKIGLPVLPHIFADPGGFSLALPLGLSYFIIRLINTQLNWYRGQLGDLSFREYLCYMIFPPTLPAGPIETVQGFIGKRVKAIGKDDIQYGFMRILIGFIKKIIIADMFLFPLVDANIFAVGLDPMAADGVHVLTLLVVNFLFVYIDFSAYSDIAIGLGRLYGYRITENFDWPVIQPNLREYWQRWHMSLSNWAMRNIYMPLTIGTRNAYVPIFATMISIGLWHVLGLTWFGWAMHHATGLAILTYLDQKRKGPLPRKWVFYGRPIRTLATIYYVSLGQSFLLFSDFNIAFKVYSRGWGLLVGIF